MKSQKPFFVTTLFYAMQLSQIVNIFVIIPLAFLYVHLRVGEITV
jgi:hypothetical protein